MRKMQFGNFSCKLLFCCPISIIKVMCIMKGYVTSLGQLLTFAGRANSGSAQRLYDHIIWPGLLGLLQFQSAGANERPAVLRWTDGLTECSRTARPAHSAHSARPQLIHLQSIDFVIGSAMRAGNCGHQLSLNKEKGSHIVFMKPICRLLSFHY